MIELAEPIKSTAAQHVTKTVNGGTHSDPWTLQPAYGAARSEPSACSRVLST